MFDAAGALLVVDAVWLFPPEICVTFWCCVVWMLWVPEVPVVVSELDVVVPVTTLWLSYVR